MKVRIARNISAHDGLNVPKTTQPYTTRLVLVHIFYCVILTNMLSFKIEANAETTEMFHLCSLKRNELSLKCPINHCKPY